MSNRRGAGSGDLRRSARGGDDASGLVPPVTDYIVIANGAANPVVADGDPVIANPM
jgi:hypothetical protein